ncbi:MAG: type II toxin-antitoxin system VapC family toxin [Pyrinomonadaceae bacterium]
MIEAFIDTSFAVALGNNKDSYHQKALELSFLMSGASLITTDCILYEIGNSLARGFREHAVATISNLITSDEIEVVKTDNILFDRAFELYKSHNDKTWGLVDCVSFVVMTDRGVAKALSNDRHFRQAGFEALLRTD